MATGTELETEKRNARSVVHRVRAFLLVCASILCLAFAYHLGAATAQAQGGTFSVGSAGPYYLAGVINRTIYALNFTNQTRWQSPPIPGTSPVLAVQDIDGEGSTVLLENGDCYRFTGGAWQGPVNLAVGQPVPVLSQTWGQVKARYR